MNSKKNFLTLLLLLALAVWLCQSGGVSPIWVPGSYFKSGPLTFVFQDISNTVKQTASITYNSALINTSLKVPTLAITDLQYMIVGGRILLKLEVSYYDKTGLQFQVSTNTKSYLTMLKITYMALDNVFTSAFSMNRFFPSLQNSVGDGINRSFYVNFTQSTGVKLVQGNENVLIPFVHYIDLSTKGTSIDFDLNFVVENISFYRVDITSTSNITINYIGFSRLIFDKTAIEALGNDYFNYGIVTATNNNNSQLSTIIPPEIIPSNFFYGMHSFAITTGLSQIKYTSAYNITSGFVGLYSAGTFVYTKMKFSYFHHKSRTCPSTHVYYNVSQVMCYDVCSSVRWYGDLSSKTCEKCLYDCYTCNNNSRCSTCSPTEDFRQINGTRCTPISGYFDDKTNTTKAKPCTSPCATCINNATYCLTCISGYYLKSNECILCSAAMTSCQTCTNASFCTLCNDNSSGVSCTTCNANQYKNAGICYLCSSAIANCASCTSSTNCTLCAATFTLKSPTSCACDTDQYLQSSQCFSCSSSVPQCITCTSATTCTSCATPYVLISPTKCACNSTTYLNPATSSCSLCSTNINYCQSCNSTTCSSCTSNFTLINTTCTCTTGFYINSVDSFCGSCGVPMTGCLECNNDAFCTKCGNGFILNPITRVCDVKTCSVDDCWDCDVANSSKCQACTTGFSLFNNTCIIKCGDSSLHSNQQCDDGNSLDGDGCSSKCLYETSFSCMQEQMNVSNSYSRCYYSATISFQKIWIRKIQGQNTVKFQFKLDQQINEWKNVDFKKILRIDEVDEVSGLSTGKIDSIIQSYEAAYKPELNRFYVLIHYKGSDLHDKSLKFSLKPYEKNLYPAFTLPSAVEFFQPIIQETVIVIPNNNQRAILYSDSIYGAYKISVGTTYAVTGIALLTVVTSLIFRAGKVITFEMLTVVQLTYFSLAFLDQMNPVFSGLLPLRFLAGIVNFKGPQQYLEQASSQNPMKGIYIFLNLYDNFSFIGFSLFSFFTLGGVLLLVYLFVDWKLNANTLSSEIINQQQKRGYILYKLAYHFLGQLSIALIFTCLPLYTICIFYEVLYTQGESKFWSYALGVGIGAAIVFYFISLIKMKVRKTEGDFNKLGEYITEYNNTGMFQNFKYTNLQMIIIAALSCLAIITIYSDSKLFTVVCIICVALVDTILVSIVKPYKYGFVSCFKGKDNQTEQMFQKIQLYKVYDNEQPQLIKIDNPDLTQKSQENDNTIFAQHFATKKNVIKTKNQGLIQAGQIMNHSKLILFNNNFRRVINHLTLIVIQFVFACTTLYSDEINKNYNTITIQVALPLLIHSVLFLNVIYNYAMVILQIVKRGEDLSKINNQHDSNTNTQLIKSIYLQKAKALSTLQNFPKSAKDKKLQIYNIQNDIAQEPAKKEVQNIDLDLGHSSVLKHYDRKQHKRGKFNETAG